MHSYDDFVDCCYMKYLELYCHYGLHSESVLMDSRLLNPRWWMGHWHEHHWHLMP